jgi:methylthioribose-1-phosphate isomerase
MKQSAFPKTRSFVWKKDRLLLLDQRALPQKIVWKTCRTWPQVAEGIRAMVVRGAPAIGCVAAYGMVLAAQRGEDLKKAHAGFLASRPTAVNLQWALERMSVIWRNGVSAYRRHGTTMLPRYSDTPLLRYGDLLKTLLQEAIAIETEDREANARMGKFGAPLVPQGATMMTVCNTGSLATAGLGTAFGVLWTAHRQGRLKKVIALETRPYLQGARLTAWELKNEKIPFELITDNMAAHLMKTEPVHGVIVGADRIAANGDTANKIGTYSLAVLAAHHEIPFYVAAPLSTLDLATPSGERIPIEERSAEEVTTVRGQAIAPEKIRVRHPAFDVTPANLIAGIITEKGIARPPYGESLSGLFAKVSSPNDPVGDPSLTKDTMDSRQRSAGMTS